jgi:3-carboxy-cis,cis-muconate cycloisomerase
LIRALQKACVGDAGQYAHWGATTQDIMDTGVVLQIKEAFEIIFRDLRENEELLLNLAERRKNTVMAGRTHGQHALPITFGYKVAVWTSELRRHIERLKECRKRLFVGQFAGAVGTLASLGEVGLKIQSLMMDDLGLEVPDIAWFTSRDRFAEFARILAMISSTFANIANEVVALQKTEIDESEEPFSKGKVGSSTMPHKRNPMISEGIIALAKIVRADLALAVEGMINEHERNMRSWQSEMGVHWRNLYNDEFHIAPIKVPHLESYS